MAASGAVMRREVKVIGLVGFAHHLSHLYQLALPPLFTPGCSRACWRA